MTTAAENKQLERTVTGKVISNKGDKTITVYVERLVKHRLYKKYIKRSTKFYAHDEDNVCNVGDIVEIQQVRPISKSKTWNLVRVVEEARG